MKRTHSQQLRYVPCKLWRLAAKRWTAAKSAHPEIDKVSWALWGNSAGAIWSGVMTTLHPERVIVVWMRSGSALMFLTHAEFARPEVSAAVCQISMMAKLGPIALLRGR